MVKIQIEPSRIFINFLRSNLSDPNGSRSGQWIFPDFPRAEDLGDNQFPRIGVTTLTETGQPLGMFDDTSWDTITFQIDIIGKKGHDMDVTTTDEALGTMSSTANSNRMSYEYIPTKNGAEVTNIKHAGTGFGTVTAKNTDADFTTPASLSAGTVEWSRSTGNLNFSAADVTSYDAEAITSTSVRFLEGQSLCKYLAREIVKNVRASWRADSTFTGLLYPMKFNNVPMPFNEDLGIFRQMLEYRCNVINAGEGL